MLGSVVLLCGTGVWVATYAGDRLRSHAFIAFDFPETSFLTGDRTALHLAAASTAAAGLLAAFLLLARLPRRGLVLAAGLAAVNTAALAFAMGPAPERVRPVPPVSGPTTGGMIADASLDWRVKTMLLYPVWWTRIEFTGVRSVPPGVCTAVVPWPGGTPAAATWPARPAGWVPEQGRAGALRWVAWTTLPAARSA
ncbi:hypothetical protein [Spirillospora albida]|uniref:hypothetical protein n=1 Tax=Spirillospora albida TaxID=58123 RepID=UPI0004C0FF24|nr:hypothetical protein [Spirillospora albida]